MKLIAVAAVSFLTVCNIQAAPLRSSVTGRGSQSVLTRRVGSAIDKVLEAVDEAPYFFGMSKTQFVSGIVQTDKQPEVEKLLEQASETPQSAPSSFQLSLQRVSPPAQTASPASLASSSNDVPRGSLHEQLSNEHGDLQTHAALGLRGHQAGTTSKARKTVGRPLKVQEGDEDIKQIQSLRAENLAKYMAEHPDARGPGGRKLRGSIHGSPEEAYKVKMQKQEVRRKWLKEHPGDAWPNTRKFYKNEEERRQGHRQIRKMSDRKRAEERRSGATPVDAPRQLH